MSLEEKYRGIINHLLAKSRANQVHWKPAGQAENGYAVFLPDGSIVISYRSPRAVPDLIQISFSGAQGRPAGTWVVEEGSADWPLALDLYNEAQRHVMGWDKVLNDIEKAITREGPIGTP